MEVANYRLTAFSNDELTGYASQIVMKLCALSENEQIVGKEFISAYNAMKSVQEQTRETYGEQIRKADVQVDRLWSMIRSLLDIYSEHYDVEVAVAAQAVAKVFHSEQNPTRLSYDEEYSKLDTLISRLDQMDAQVLKTAQLDGWIHQFKKRIAEFKTLRGAKTDAQSEVVIGTSKQARLQLIEAQKILIKKVNAYLIFNETESMVAFAKKLNEINEETARIRKATEKRENNGKSSPTETPSQE